MQALRCGMLTLFLTCEINGTASAQTTYIWNDTTSDWAQSTAWNPVAPNWTIAARLSDSIASFGPQSTVAHQPDINSNFLFANGVNFDNSGGAGWNLTGSTGLLAIGEGGLNVSGAANSTITAVISGTTTVTKSGGGTFIFDGIGSNIFGGITVTGGTVQAGSAANNTANQILRSNSIDLGLGTELRTVGTAGNYHLAVGGLSGSGLVMPGSTGGINELVLEDSYFSGTISAAGGFNLRGNNGTTQTFTGNLTGLDSNSNAVSPFSGGTLRLSGNGDTTSGVFGASQVITVRGGTVLLDNTGGDTLSPYGRIGDAATVTLGGGSFSLIGDSTGSIETVGAFTMQSGSSTISVTNNGGTGTVLAFTDSGSLRNVNSGTLNFIGLGTGTLGLAGNNPRITFSGSIFTNTSNGALSDASGTSLNIGWARVNGTSWAGVGPNGIVALTETGRTSTTLPSAAAWEVTTFTPTQTTTTLGAPLGVATTPLLFKITPSATGQRLASGGFNINAVAVMLAGSTDFSITGTGALFGTVAAPRQIYVTNGDTVLSVAPSLAGAQQPFNKAGAGTLFLSGGSNQLNFTSNQSVNILEGTLRGTITSLGGAFTTTNLYGGVLEISGGGTYSRALNLTGLAGGGGIRWDSGTSRGDGGFSAINGNATVQLFQAIGGPTLATPIWGMNGFVADGYALRFGSSKANGILNFTNDIGLDNGSTSNPYFAREIRVADNPSSTGDKAILSGLITGSVNADLLKTGPGFLELLGQNTYRGNTLVYGGTLVVGDSGTIGTASIPTGHIIVGSGATFASTGGAVDGGVLNLYLAPASVITVNPGGAIRGGNPTDATYSLQTLVTNSSVVIKSNSTANGILRVEAAHNTSPAQNGNVNADSSLILLLDDTKLFNFKTGAGNKFTIDVVNNAASPLHIGTPYTISLVHSVGGIELDGSLLGANANIPSSNYELRGSDFAFANASLDLDGSGEYLLLTFTPVPVPEPPTVLGIAAAALCVGRFVLRRWKKTTASTAA